MITSFWIVTKPKHNSTLEDICFMTNAGGLILQGRGGLEPDEIYGMYTDKDEAETAATALLLMQASFALAQERIRNTD